MEAYTIDRTSNSRREAVEKWLFGLDLVSADTRERIVTAWVSTWSSSPYATLEEMPFSNNADYPLHLHVNEVTKAGMELAKRAAADWGVELDPEILVPILILHDVDKPLMYVRRNGGVEHSEVYHELPHGVLGAMVLKDLGFAQSVVSSVALHAGNAPYHGRNFEAFVLHYADYFSADHALMSVGRKPFYQK